MRTLLLLSVAATCAAEEVPLSQIWAWETPGTRDVRDLGISKARKRAEGLAAYRHIDPAIASGIQRVRESLNAPLADEALPAFAVVGEGADALKAIAGVSSGEAPPLATLPASEPVSVCFHSRSTGIYVHLVAAAVEGKRIRIEYEFVPHIDAAQTHHFAIIPIGRLGPGNYRIEIVQRPMRKQFTRLGGKPPERPSRIVCGPSEFTVVGRDQDD